MAFLLLHNYTDFIRNENLLVYAILFLIVLVVSFVITKIEVRLVNKKRISTGNHEII